MTLWLISRAREPERSRLVGVCRAEGRAEVAHRGARGAYGSERPSPGGDVRCVREGDGGGWAPRQSVWRFARPRCQPGPWVEYPRLLGSDLPRPRSAVSRSPVAGFLICAANTAGAGLLEARVRSRIPAALVSLRGRKKVAWMTCSIPITASPAANTGRDAVSETSFLLIDTVLFSHATPQH